jgi:sugar-specific transcriptional regulator TrmB
MIYHKILREIGFSDKEINVYTALLELDSASVTTIAKKTELNRTSCYDILDALMKRGIISKFKKKHTTYYNAGDPRRLKAHVDHELEKAQKKAMRQQKLLSDALPELQSLLNPQSTKPKVTFYEGEEGMREAYEDTLTSSEEILAFANVVTMHEGLPAFFPEYYAKRVAAGIHIKSIMPNNEASRDRASKDEQESRQSILLDGDDTFSPEVNIYDNKMLIASWTEKIAVIIESKELADLQKLIYRLLWNKLKKS